MKAFFSRWLAKLTSYEASPTRLAWSIALGVYLSFSPLLGIQTPLAFVLGWIFSLNIIVINIVLYAVNNPWTLVPIQVLDYIVGRFIVTDILRLDLVPYNPGFIDWLWARIGPYLEPYIGTQPFCFWSYQIGGHLVAVVCAGLTYLLVVRALRRNGTISALAVSPARKRRQSHVERIVVSTKRS